ncbi:amino acid adenylation domain-containing protein [Calothrix sp. FACHB-1219]|uniref:non-ribosomal peptide synthetase n=1 Tax=unclassified Calothrix TaxID=2619626 RepID=UPI001685DE8F|nr:MULTISPECIES: non-ribosomal peptide synthetase [unclassified Calothrix]MBD2201832.1 amino acid adenylation domain-containing protein [Calothrix sp. FACHB-168]MBD2217518.1 amino acid adenylation domain-containing protein [Calothrix sp. FACHB-1219]
MSKYDRSSVSYQPNCSTVVELLGLRSSTQPNRDAFTFLLDGETEQATLSYQELDRLARRVAARLQGLGLTGERALLLYPAGLDFLIAFFGCLYAGVVAVTAYPPRNQRNTPRITAIANDAQAAIALTTKELFSTVQSLMTAKTDSKSLQWLTTDNLTEGLEDNWQKPHIDRDTLAFLQYTSGSTGTPKGVMISHGNLLHNAQTTCQFMEHSADSKFVTWLPMYHDMGLIGGILQPLYGGFPCIIMAPAAFLQRPYRWLQAISQYQGTTSGGPNFAYDLCVQKITPEQKATLDLSSWNVAFNGAEPIRYDTLQRFAEAFAECRFRKEAFYPCYGMAETTLMVSGVDKATAPLVKALEKSALECNRFVEASVTDENFSQFVSCGRVIPQQKVVITNPETLKTCQPDEIGEIWVSGLSVGQGYWDREQETKETFQAYLADTGEGPFLRTGDLGFLQDGELFITGRAKDLIIIRGRNLYPQDIELTCERSHPSLRAGASAAFTVEIDNEEKLVIVQELEFRAKPNLAEVVNAIRQGVTEEHEVQVYAVVLIKPGSIPKTSSGKIQRRATSSQFQNGELNIIASDILKISDRVSTETNLQRSQLLALSPKECQTALEAYLIELLARVLFISSDAIAPQEPLSRLGLDSLKVFEIKNRIEVDLEVDISIADFFAGMSLRSLVTQILAQISSPSLTQQQINRSHTSTYPLSFAQQGLWFINQLNPNSPTYNIPLIIRLQGWVNLIALEDSLNEIIQRHQVLRTSLTVVDEQPVQVIHQAQPINLIVEDLRELPETERDRTLQSLAREFAQQPFDLSNHSLLRAKIWQINDKNYYLALTIHHIIADGWSVGVLIQELTAIYAAFSTGKASPLLELPIQYGDFVNWQRKWLDSQRIQPLLTYWKQKLQGELPVLNLPTDYPRPPVQTFQGSQAKLVISPALTQQLKHFSSQQEVTLFMTLLTAFKILLYRYTGQTDILVGSPIANRHRAETQSLIGFFVNVLVLRTELADNLSFQDLLMRVKSTTLEAYVHQDLPLEKLVEELQPSRDLSYNPLFQVMFVLQNIPKPNLSLSDVAVSYEEGDNGTSKFDLTLFMEDSPAGLVATCEYNRDLFHADTINRMLGHFQTLIESIVSNPKQSISQLQLLTPPETQQLLVEWNNTQTDYPEDKCIHQLFEEQVEKTPDAIAVIFENQQLTYRELNSQANQLAHYLQELGVKPETIVGIYMERSLLMVVALIAVLKAGGAYLPLEPSYPKERLAFMLEDAQVSLVLTQADLSNQLPQHPAQFISVDIKDLGDKNYSYNNPHSDVKPENLVYVIYTSGSTGKPKGVMNIHRGLCNRLLWMQDTYQLTSTDRVLQKTPFSFDVSVWEFFWTLLTGATLVIAKPGGHQQPRYLVELISQQQVTVLHFVPSMLQVFLEETEHQKCQSIKHVICSGEALNYDLQQRFFQSFAAELHNLYGPTEASIDVTAWRCESVNDEKIVPIGRPIANTQIFILDRHLQPVPVGVPGELYIGGLGLARGYLNRAELTQEKFINHPFKELQSNNRFDRLYKTGDLARYRSNGNIEFLGRIDYQVKIRGNRLELGEIEAVLMQHPQVREAVVIAREDILDDWRLVAYLVVRGNTQPSINELRGFIQAKLPDYMLPHSFILLDALPLTANGKVDRRALPVPQSLRPQLTTNYQLPQSQIEQKIAKVWQELLHIEQVGIHDNFFDLGGHSLLMLKVNQKLSAILQRDLSVVTMFQNPTIYSLAQYLSQEQQISFSGTSDRAQKQIEAINRQKQLLSKQGRKNHG